MHKESKYTSGRIGNRLNPRPGLHTPTDGCFFGARTTFVARLAIAEPAKRLEPVATVYWLCRIQSGRPKHRRSLLVSIDHQLLVLKALAPGHATRRRLEHTFASVDNRV